MGTYIIGDAHGCFDELQALLSKIEKKDKNARFIFTGDLLDRGPKNVKMAEWAIKNIKGNEKYRAVCGNHDAGIADWVKDNKMGLIYPYHYGTEIDFKKANKVPLLKKYAKLVKSFPLYIEEEINGKIFVITHGYIPENYKRFDAYDEKEDIRSLFYWDRSALYGAESPITDVTVVCGHNPVILPEWIEAHPNHEICTVYIGESLINVDTGCFHSGLLSAYCLETEEVFYSGEPGLEGFQKRKGII